MAKRLCNKDPYTALHMTFLNQVFPKSKHILMIRDARAIIHSIIERKVPVYGYNHSDHRVMFPKSKHILMIRDARAIIHSIVERKVPVYGYNHSNHRVFYERLVQRTKEEALRILKFLNIPWSDDVLRHYEKIGKK
ncbi:unnamed protein product, partial [Strongylus vulgaris]